MIPVLSSVRDCARHSSSSSSRRDTIGRLDFYRHHAAAVSIDLSLACCCMIVSAFLFMRAIKKKTLHVYYSVIAQLVKCVFVWIEWWHETIRVCYNNRAAIIIVVQSVVTCCGVVRRVWIGNDRYSYGRPETTAAAA